MASGSSSQQNGQQPRQVSPSPAASFFAAINAGPRPPTRSFSAGESEASGSFATYNTQQSAPPVDNAAHGAHLGRSQSLRNPPRADPFGPLSFTAAGADLQTGPQSAGPAHYTPPAAARHPLFAHHASPPQQPAGYSPAPSVASDPGHVPPISIETSITPSSPGSTVSSTFSPATRATAFLSAFSPRSPTEAPDAQGARVLDYTLGKVLGRGGFSTVRQAIHVKTGEIFACKIVKRDDLSDESGSAARFEDEIRIWQTLPRHPRILPLLEMKRTVYATFMIMPALEGSLLDILRLEGGSESTARKWFPGVVEAVAVLHEGFEGFDGQMMHGDLKLDNFLYDKNGGVCIGDFGMAAKIERAASTKRGPSPANHRPSNLPTHMQVRGRLSSAPDPPRMSSRSPRGRRDTLATTEVNQAGHQPCPSASLPYASPELLHASPAGPSLAQDIWALGIILHALLTGRLPFTDSFDPRLQMKILKGKWEDPYVGHEWLECLHGMLHRDVNRRWDIQRVRHSDAVTGWREVRTKSRSRSRPRFDGAGRGGRRTPGDSPIHAHHSEGPSARGRDRSRSRAGQFPQPHISPARHDSDGPRGRFLYPQNSSADGSRSRSQSGNRLVNNSRPSSLRIDVPRLGTRNPSDGLASDLDGMAITRGRSREARGRSPSASAASAHPVEEAGRDASRSRSTSRPQRPLSGADGGQRRGRSRPRSDVSIPGTAGWWDHQRGHERHDSSPGSGAHTGTHTPPRPPTHGFELDPLDENAQLSQVKLHRDISESPSRGGVVEVVDASRNADIEADTAADLRLWSILEALKHGSLPSNTQLDQFLELASTTVTQLGSQGMSGDTRMSIKAFTDLVDTLRKAIREKNGDELIQDTLWMAWFETRSGVQRGATSLVAAGGGGGDMRAKSPVGRGTGTSPAQEKAVDVAGGEEEGSIEDDLARDVQATARDRGERDGELREAVAHIRTLGTILFTNSQLRAAITDLTALARQTSAKSRANSMAGEDQAAGGEPVQPGKEAEAIDTQGAVEATQEEEADWRDPGHDFHVPGAFESDSDDDVFVDADPQPQLDPEVAAFLQKLRGAIASMQDQPGYAAAMTWLLDTFEAYEAEVTARLNPDLVHPSSSPMRAKMTPTRRILANLVTLAERFAANRSLNPVQVAVRKLYAYVLADPVSQELVLEIDAFIRRVLNERGYVMTAACVVRGEELWERLRAWLSNSVYQAQWDAVWAGMSHFLGVAPLDMSTFTNPSLGSLHKAAAWFSDDPLTRELDARWTALTDALLLDSAGRLVVKRGMWSDLGKMVGRIVNWRGFITLPRVELVTPNVELVLENVHLSLANLFPTLLDVNVDDRVRFSALPQLQGSCASATKTRVRLSGEQVQADVRGALVAMRLLKLGISDSGHADIALSRKGISFDIELEIDTHPTSPWIVQARHIEFGIDELAIAARGTRRDALYALLLPLGLQWLKWRMTSRWKLKLGAKIKELNLELMELRERLQAAAAVPRSASRKKTTPAAAIEPRASTRLMTVLLARLRELQSAVSQHKQEKQRAIDAYRRHRRLSESSSRSSSSSRARQERRGSTGAATAAEDDAETTGDESSDEDEPPGPGEPEAPLRGFKISFSLRDAILPNVTADAASSILYRRERAERGARPGRLDLGKERGHFATTTGLRGTGRPWRSSVFTAVNPAHHT